MNNYYNKTIKLSDTNYLSFINKTRNTSNNINERYNQKYQ